MTHLLSLENFDVQQGSLSLGGGQLESEIDISDELGAFEKGYKAGWDDSASALVREHQRLSADFAANLSDLSFTYYEARAHVLKGVEAVMREILVKLLPETARQALPQLVWEQVSGILEASASTPLKILVAPNSRADMDALFPDDPGFPLVIIEEPTLTDGQVFLRSGDIEQVIDISLALSEIETGLTDFFSAQKESLRSNG